MEWAVFQGVVTALVTPSRKVGSVDAVVVAATDSTLTDEEHREVVCIGRSTTAHVMRLCRNAREAGADALLLVTAFISTRRLKGVWSSILPSKRSLSTCS